MPRDEVLIVDNITECIEESNRTGVPIYTILKRKRKEESEDEGAATPKRPANSATGLHPEPKPNPSLSAASDSKMESGPTNMAKNEQNTKDAGDAKEAQVADAAKVTSNAQETADGAKPSDKTTVTDTAKNDSYAQHRTMVINVLRSKEKTIADQKAELDMLKAKLEEIYRGNGPVFELNSAVQEYVKELRGLKDKLDQMAMQLEVLSWRAKMLLPPNALQLPPRGGLC
ncbi:hypothetical protein F4810DRAFT_653988 [Camillea tinctor]|nr:hypothetical protein F4810DRAFT_653988 [Camillea tinctor]